MSFDLPTPVVGDAVVLIVSGELTQAHVVRVDDKPPLKNARFHLRATDNNMPLGWFHRHELAVWG